MGYGEIAAAQIKGMADNARNGIFTEADMRKGAEALWSTLSDDDKQEAKQILNQHLGNSQTGGTR